MSFVQNDFIIPAIVTLYGSKRRKKWSEDQLPNDGSVLLLFRVWNIPVNFIVLDVMTWIMKVIKSMQHRLSALTPKGTTSRILGVAAVASGIGFAANNWVERFAEPHMYREIADVPRRHTAIVLGAKVYPSGEPSVTLEDRLYVALELYRKGKVKKILVSGDHGAPEYNECGAMWQWLKQRGVAAEDVFQDHAGLRTLDTMERARRVFTVKSAVICTQKFHLARSVFLARRAGIDAVGVVADRRGYAKRRHNATREFLARTVSFLDSYILGTKPRYEGDAIPITGNGIVTHEDTGDK